MMSFKKPTAKKKKKANCKYLEDLRAYEDKQKAIST